MYHRWTSMSHLCEHRCHNAVSCHYFHSDMRIAVILMWTSLSQRCQLPLLSQWYHRCTSLSHLCEHRCRSAVSCHYFHSDMRIAVTLMWTSLSQRCQLPLLSQWYAHRCHTNVNIAVTALSVVPALWDSSCVYSKCMGKCSTFSPL